jgi:hypothetical protein
VLIHADPVAKDGALRVRTAWIHGDKSDLFTLAA